jgi:hypothetical protein
VRSVLTIEYIAYILNRTPTKVLPNGKTPKQCLGDYLDLQGVELSVVEYLHVYGCRAYVRIPNKRHQKGAKMDQRALEGVLVGYKGRNGHIYRVYIPERGLVRSRDVTFNEASTPSILLKPPLQLFEVTPEGFQCIIQPA